MSEGGDDVHAEEAAPLWVVYVAHGESYAERQSKPIDAEVWRTLVGGDPSLTPTDHVLTRNDIHEPIRKLTRANSARWTGHPRGLRVTFSLRRFAVEMVLPDYEDPEADANGFPSVDADARAKAEEIARALGAHVFVKRVEF